MDHLLRQILFKNEQSVALANLVKNENISHTNYSHVIFIYLSLGALLRNIVSVCTIIQMWNSPTMNEQYASR